MKLSNIKYSDLLFKYKKSDIEKIIFDNFQMENKNTDFGIVFGGISMIPYRVEKALKLYNAHNINKIILTGGIGYFNSDRFITEAMKMKKYLIRKGVNEKDMIIESSSRTSYENIKNILDLLKNQGEIDNKTYTLITSDFHLKRCMLMMSKLIDKKRLYAVAVKDNKTDIDNWYKSLYGKVIIKREIILMRYYAKKGIIEDIDI